MIIVTAPWGISKLIPCKTTSSIVQPTLMSFILMNVSPDIRLLSFGSSRIWSSCSLKRSLEDSNVSAVSVPINRLSLFVSSSRNISIRRRQPKELAIVVMYLRKISSLSMKILRMVKEVNRILVLRAGEVLRRDMSPKTVYVIHRVPLRLIVCNKVKYVIQRRTFLFLTTSACRSERILDSILSTRPRIFTPLIAEMTEEVKPTLLSVASSHCFWRWIYDPEPVPVRDDNTAEKMRGAKKLEVVSESVQWSIRDFSR
jgi:hypothetical protein